MIETSEQKTSRTLRRYLIAFLRLRGAADKGSCIDDHRRVFTYWSIRMDELDPKRRIRSHALSALVQEETLAKANTPQPSCES